MNENKIMDKINNNLKIIDNLLMENGFYKYISKVVNIEDGTSQLYDNLKQTQQENARLKDKIEKAIMYIENTYDDVLSSFTEDKPMTNFKARKELLEILKEN